MAFDMNMGDSRSMIVRLSEKSKERENTYNFDPPLTLGKPKKGTKEGKACMAMDSCIKNVLSGFKNDLMYTTTPMFVGYAMLSNVAQEALIRAGVETVAGEMTRKFVQWTYDDDYGEEEKEKAIADLEDQAAKYKLRETFYQASVKDGYFGGCLVYIDVGELDDEEKAEPLILDPKTFKKGSLRGFKIIEPINIYPGTYNTTDPTDEHYFNPEYWYILGKKYHASRFLYFASNEAPLLLKPAYNFFGIPQAQLALDYVAHFVANREAAQELLNKFSLTCWKTNMGQALQGKSCNDLVKRAQMLIRTKSNNGIMIFDKETEDLVQVNTPLSGVRDIVEMSLNLLTAVWHIPKIEYLGEGEGGLNASSKEQIRSYYDYIMGKKEKDYTQPLETVLKIFQLNMGKGINPALGFKFPAMWDMDDAERAALNKQQADRDAIYLANGVLSQEEVRRRLSLDRNSEYTMIDVDDLPETQEEPLKEVDEEEENEKVRQAMDMALDIMDKNGCNHDVDGKFCEKPDIKNFEDLEKYAIDNNLIVPFPEKYRGKTEEEIYKELGFGEDGRAKIKSPIEDVTITKKNVFHLVKENDDDRKTFLFSGIETIKNPNIIVKEEKRGKPFNKYFKIFSSGDKNKPFIQIVRNAPDGNFYTTMMRIRLKQVSQKIKGQVVYYSPSHHAEEDKLSSRANDIIAKDDALVNINLHLDKEFLLIKNKETGFIDKIRDYFS